jgi:sporulation protein YlmC with PRC-barrel domain
MKKGSASRAMKAMRIPRWIWGIVTLAIVSIVWVGTIAHADDQIMMESHTIRMIGKPVKSSEGKKLGRIKDLVINWRSDGYAQYAVLSVGGFLGLGEQHVAVPWVTLTPSKDKEHFVLNMNEEQLKDMAASTVYRFYDRSSAAGFRGSRSTTASPAHAMKSGGNSEANISIAMSFGMQNTTEPNTHR